MIQRGAAAIYTPEGREQTRAAIAYYQNNAKVIREGLSAAGLECFGGVNAPYIWLKTPDGMGSWDFFDLVLDRANVATTPGAGFGPSGEGYIRLTAFGDADATQEAVDRIRAMLDKYTHRGRTHAGESSSARVFLSTAIFSLRDR